MGQAIRNITIVGGGTSGWLAALYFVSQYKLRVASGDMVIRLVESDRIPIIGVGESLSPSMPETMRALGLSERDFFRETDATFKLAGYFPGWDNAADGSPMSWVNPFVGYLTGGHEFERFELAGHAHGLGPDYARTISPCREAIEQQKGPRPIGAPDYETLLRYAYHTDASKFAPFLKRHAIERGVEHVVGDVVDADLDERGFVTALQMDGGTSHPVELVIDSSGFAAAIIGKKLGVGRERHGDYLINDRAVVTQLDHADGDDIEPATRATALPHGWAFRVPLYTRTGNGYIFSSAHVDDETAMREFAAYLGKKPEDMQMRVIPMHIGCLERAWEKNCVGIGLAASFVEPLEASAIYTAELMLRWLFNYFPDSDFDPALARRFNERTSALFEEIRDYIILHYRISNREDTAYWRAQRHEVKLPERLEENLKVWRHALPVRGDFPSTHYFDHNTYISALFGKGFYPGGTLRPAVTMDPAQWANTKASIENMHRSAMARLPGHKALVESLRSPA